MYHSPIRISGLSNEQLAGDAPPRAVLLAARRKLEAELMLAGTNTIVVGDAVLNLQDIIALFDDLADPLRLQYHLAVFNDQRLLDFLETGELLEGKYWRRSELYQQPNFLEFISPFYAAAINMLYTKVLKGQQPLTALTALGNNPSLLTAADADVAYQPARRHFLNKQEVLTHLQAAVRSGEIPVSSADFNTITASDVHILNSLPDLYDRTRVDVALALKGLSGAFYDRGFNRQSLTAIELAAAIRLTDIGLAASIQEDLKTVQRISHQGFYYVDAQAARRQIPRYTLAKAEKEEIVHYKGTIIRHISRSAGNRIMLYLILGIILICIVCAIAGKSRKAGERTIQVNGTQYRIPT